MRCWRPFGLNAPNSMHHHHHFSEGLTMFAFIFDNGGIGPLLLLAGVFMVFKTLGQAAKSEAGSAFLSGFVKGFFSKR